MITIVKLIVKTMITIVKLITIATFDNVFIVIVIVYIICIGLEFA